MDGLLLSNWKKQKQFYTVEEGLSGLYVQCKLICGPLRMSNESIQVYLRTMRQKEPEEEARYVS